MQINTLPFQPKFKVMVAGKNVTEYIAGDITVSFELQKPIVCTLSFVSSESQLHTLSFGTSVVVWAGYEREVEYNASEVTNSASEFGIIFSGELKKKGVTANSNGISFFVITAYDRSYSRSGHATHIYRYPGKTTDSKRQWINKDTLKTKDIVEQIVKGMQKESKIDLGEIENISWGVNAPLVQENISDMAFLNLLAERSGCYVWSDYEPVENSSEVKEVIHFKSKKAVVQKTNVSFVFLNRYKELPTLYEFEKRDFVANKLYLTNASIEVDPLADGFPVTRITDFNLSTGEEEEKFVMYDEIKGQVVYYVLVQERVDALQNTTEGREEARRIQDFGMFDIPWEQARKFFDEKVISNDIIDQIDSPVYGISLNATCRGSIAIRPFRRYTVEGIPMVHKTLSQRKAAFYLKAMTHTISPSGFFTDLEFKA